MPTPLDPTQQREFRCDHCKGLIRIPATLPPTTAPCPHCAQNLTSPAPEEFTANAAGLFPSVFAEENILPAKGPKIRREDDDFEEVEIQETKRSYLVAILGLFAVALAVAVGGTLALREMKKAPSIPKDKAILDSEAIRETHYIRTGWKEDAYQALNGFLQAKTAQEKASYVLHGDALLNKMKAFYGDATINDSDTPAEAFSVLNLSEEDRRRGLFMLVFDQPPQFSMRDFFRPLASLEVQYGLSEADLLLTSLARVSNFAIDPMRVHAFFRRTPDGLKLDWEIFVQTKYRLLQNFLEDPQIANKATFRVFIMEDVSDQRFSIVTSRTYRIADPANTDYSARIVVPVDSDVGRQLSVINWVGSDGNKPITRTATLELEWRGSGDQAHIAINRFLCWEFMGLGGEEIQAKPKSPPSEKPDSTPQPENSASENP